MTRISDMTPLSVASPTGIYVPVEKTGSTTNYRVDIAATMSVTPQMFGSVGDGATDDHVALQAWLDWGGGLFLPAAEYYSSDNLTLRKNASIEGDGYGFDARIVDGSATLGYDNQPGSRIRFAAGKGFRVDPQTTVTDVATAVAAGVAGYTQEGGFHSVIRNLALVGAGTGTAVAGFYSRSEVHLENVYALKFAGKGFDISASAGAPDGNSEYGSADLCTLKNCQAISNGSHGFHVRGSEVNVIGLDTCNAFGNGGWGYLDESELGLNYTNCHAAGNTSGSFKCIGSVANSTYTGCYVEQDTGKAPDLSSRCIVSGGYLADTVLLYNVGTNGNPTNFNGSGIATGALTLKTAQSEGAAISGEALIYRGANNGLNLQGAPTGGGTYDVALINKSGGTAAAVPTGTLGVHFFGLMTVDFNGFLFNGASSFPGLVATQAYAFSSTANGFVAAGYGTTYDACLANHSGTIALRVPTGTTDVEVTGKLASSSATGGLGYSTGAGGAVTQITSKATATPAINKTCGQVTMNNAALAAGAKVSFIVTNSTVAATDVVMVSIASGGTANAYRAAVTAISAGVSFTITVENITAGSLSEAPVVNFAILRAVAA